jgi:tRNA U54 and U55 pseudouridine synthase Pus10
MQKISRDLNSAEAPDAKERSRALSHVLTLLRDEYTMEVSDYNDVLSEICRPIFKRYADTSEKCRDLAFRISILLFEVGFRLSFLCCLSTTHY